ncbi:MAG: helix-turn-helix domain-containing protein [Armatimonadetes bacterium]|nr:helix-turn-helix domain-containing protein [Armatimonadota bacterium]
MANIHISNACRITLDCPPELVVCGVGRHGGIQLVDEFFLPDLWCFHIYSYEGSLELDGVPYPIRPGAVSIIPASTQIVYRYLGHSEHVYFHFRPDAQGTAMAVPFVYDLHERYMPIYERVRKTAMSPLQNPASQLAILWSLLWESAEMMRDVPGSDYPQNHPAVELALRLIEERMSGPLSIQGISNEVGVSEGYLSRLFQVACGRSVVSHIRTRRADLAEHLLASTTMPIKTIARTVGVPDLHQFNRLLHQMKGQSPREVRKRSLRLP